LPSGVSRRAVLLLAWSATGIFHTGSVFLIAAADEPFCGTGRQNN
jgi:hypothetical protein